MLKAMPGIMRISMMTIRKAPLALEAYLARPYAAGMLSTSAHSVLTDDTIRLLIM